MADPVELGELRSNQFFLACSAPFHQSFTRDGMIAVRTVLSLLHPLSNATFMEVMTAFGHAKRRFL